MTVLLYMIALFLGCIIGHTMGADKRVQLAIQLESMRKSRDAALEHANFWKAMYEGPSGEADE